MESEHRFWISIWALVAAGILALITIIAIGSAYQSRLVASALEKGGDPMTISCAIRGSSASTGCIALGAINGR